MLELRPHCECCARPLPADSLEAMICSFECTFCASCVSGRLAGICPNCGGDFAPRPRRRGTALQEHAVATATATTATRPAPCAGA